MKFQGESFFQTPRDRVWAALVEPDTLLARLKGFQRLDPIGNHEYEGAFDVSVGEVRGDFQGTLELADLKPPSSLRFSLNAMGAAGFVDGDGLMVLEEAAGGTRIHYDFDAKVGGRIAGVGEGALEAWARTLARDALDGLGQRAGANPAPAKFKIVTKQEVAKHVERSPVERAEPEVRLAEGVKGGVAADAAEKLPEPKSSDRGGESTIAPDHGQKAQALDATTSPTVATAESSPAPSRTESIPLRQGQYGSRISRDFADRFNGVVRRPEVLGAALVLYTIFVILMTRSCS